MNLALSLARWSSCAALACLAWPGALQAAELDARALLERMRMAASAGNYQGTMVFSANGSMTSSRVWHYSVGEQTFERVEALDGDLQRIYRHNDEVRTFWPQARVAVVERREALVGWSTTPQTVEPRALENYALRPEGEARVAGREAAVVLLEPRDVLRYAQRLWADRSTGLMLRADVLGPGGAVLETTAFSEIEIGVRPNPDSVLQPMRRLDAAGGERRIEGRQEGRSAPRSDLLPRSEARAEPAEAVRVLRPPLRRTQLDAEGWWLRQDVPGFRSAGCVQRTIQGGRDEVPVLQAVFSDGLTHVSLFIEPFRADRHRGPAQSQLGATRTVTRRVGEHWVTAVGDVPPETLKQFADALERRR